MVFPVELKFDVRHIESKLQVDGVAEFRTRKHLLFGRTGPEEFQEIVAGVRSSIAISNSAGFDSHVVEGFDHYRNVLLGANSGDLDRFQKDGVVSSEKLAHNVLSYIILNQ